MAKSQTAVPTAREVRDQLAKAGVNVTMKLIGDALGRKLTGRTPLPESEEEIVAALREKVSDDIRPLLDSYQPRDNSKSKPKSKATAKKVARATAKAEEEVPAEADMTEAKGYTPSDAGQAVEHYVPKTRQGQLGGRRTLWTEADKRKLSDVAGIADDVKKFKKAHPGGWLPEPEELVDCDHRSRQDRDKMDRGMTKKVRHPILSGEWIYVDPERYMELSLNGEGIDIADVSVTRAIRGKLERLSPFRPKRGQDEEGPLCDQCDFPVLDEDEIEQWLFSEARQIALGRKRASGWEPSHRHPFCSGWLNQMIVPVTEFVKEINRIEQEEQETKQTKTTKARHQRERSQALQQVREAADKAWAHAFAETQTQLKSRRGKELDRDITRAQARRIGDKLIERVQEAEQQRSQGAKQAATPRKATRARKSRKAASNA